MYEIAVVASRRRSILNILGEISVGLQLSSTFISHATFFYGLFVTKFVAKTLLSTCYFIIHYKTASLKIHSTYVGQ